MKYGRITRGALLACLVVAWAAQGAEERPIPGGELRIVGQDGVLAAACPLKHTAVEADIVGFVGRVTVRQVFHNPTDGKIEAVYIFPLPAGAAVDEMVMTVGDRRIVGLVKERGEAREIYEQARAAGHVAGLLDQERPNIFTQSVANIEPGVEVEIEISYVETLKYDDGVFEWDFPMVVGPRYIPGGGCAPEPMTTGTPTAQVPDAERITPPVTPEGTRAGHDISLTVTIDAGLPIHDLASELHDISALALSGAADSPVRVTLRDEVEIPNRDFILRYRLTTDEIGDAYMMHEDERGRFFTLILQPPARVAPDELMARELIFVLDTSGSMSGFPIEKAKEVMMKLVDTMRPADTFNVITFAGDTHILWQQPRAATGRNITLARKFLRSRQGGGGTEMMKAINAALVQTPSQSGEESLTDPIRVVCFMTDGYVGNDFAIIDAVRKNAGTTRVFSFGAGNSVNRFLLDGMAHAGRGAVEYVTLESQADAAVERFHERILSPVLTDIEIDWGDLPVSDVYPRRIPDLFSAQPIMIHGRLTGEPVGTITLRGNTGVGAYEEEIRVSWPSEPPDHLALPSLWARAKVEDLMMRDYGEQQCGTLPDESKQTVIELGVKYQLMTQFTSFVAVEEMTVTAGGEPTTIMVPVEMPAGVSYEGVFGGSSGEWLFCYSQGAGHRKSGGLSANRQRAMVVAGAPRTPVSTRDQACVDAILTEADDEESVRALDVEDVAWAKLAESLRELAAKVEKDGHDGDLIIGNMKIAGYRVDVMVFLRDTSEATLAALMELGFEQTGESKAVRLLVGGIDVRKLMELAGIDAVVGVRPAVSP